MALGNVWKTNDENLWFFFIQLCRLVTPYNIVLKIFHLRNNFCTILYRVTKWLSWLKFFINTQRQVTEMLKTIFIFRIWIPNLHVMTLSLISCLICIISFKFMFDYIVQNIKKYERIEYNRFKMLSHIFFLLVHTILL